MLTDKGNIVIPPKPQNPAENYEWLRNTGLSYIQQFSGKIWTDYNVHDPGVTMLELLCYALTDLAYRNSLPVADLLTAPGEKGPDSRDFFTARKILTSHPITEADYRKLVLDRIPGVRNIWLETLDDQAYDPAIYFDHITATTGLVLPPAKHPFEKIKLKGLYVVKLDVEDFETIRGQHPNFLKTLARYRDEDSAHTEPEALIDEYKRCMVNYVASLLYASRNLCEDFEIVKVAEEEWVAVCADIELKPEANADAIFQQINSILYNHINPSLQFYSFKELIDKGKRTEDIFNGPAATRGFIDADELKNHGHKEVIYVSDIINKLMDIKGVLQIKSIHLSSYRLKLDGTYAIIEDAQQYCLHLKDKTNAVFKFMLDAGEQDKKKIFNHIRFSKGPVYFSPVRKPAYKGQGFIDYPNLPDDFTNDLPIPAGKNRNLDKYFSVQNDFPLCYYTGMDGIPNGATNLRKAQRLQTKAYLLLFDQVLANYLAQLNNLKSTFSWRGGVGAATLLALPLDETIVKDLRELLASGYKPGDPNVDDAVFFKDSYTKYGKDIETAREKKNRRNRLMDHLLARFNELFVDYSVFKFQQNTEGDFFDQGATEETINDKIQFLKLYPVISSRRSHAINYVKSLVATDNISGFQLRLQKMIGLASSRNRNLVKPLNSIDYKILLQDILSGATPDPSKKLELKDNRFTAFDKAFGFHVLEHILLRPLHGQSTTPLTKLLPLCGDGSNNQHADCLLPDNYSMQLTVVLPGWLSISSNMDFRAFTENLARTEAPAHAAIKICWLDPARMFLFEKTTAAFFTAMSIIKAVGAKPTPAEITNFNQALEDVYSMMGILKNMYQPSRLNECENINYNETTDQINTPLILNYSALGSNGDTEWYVFAKNEVVVPPIDTPPVERPPVGPPPSDGPADTPPIANPGNQDPALPPPVEPEPTPAEPSPTDPPPLGRMVTKKITKAKTVPGEKIIRERKKK